MIRNWQPWKLSTGAKTEGGKEKSKMNAVKHAVYSSESLENLKKVKDLLNYIKLNCSLDK